MPFCGHASAWSKLELLLLVPAISLHCAGLGTPYWMKTATTRNDVHLIVGLWKIVDCSGETDQPCVGQALLEKYKTDLLTVTRAFELMVLVTAAFALLFSLYYVLSPAVRTQRVALVIMLLCFSSMVFGLLGCGTWILNLPQKHYVFWSMGLTVVGSSLFMVCGTLMIPDFRMYDYQMIHQRLKEKAEKRKKKKSKKLEKHKQEP